MQFFKIGLKPTKSAKRMKQTCSPPFWGDVGIKKCFFVLASKVPSFGTCQRALLSKVAVFKCPKMALRAQKQKNEDHGPLSKRLLKGTFFTTSLINVILEIH